MSSDAVSKRPTFAEEAKTFQGFATTDGEISAGGQTAQETEVLAAREALAAADKIVAAKSAKQSAKLGIAPDPKTVVEDDEDEDDSILSDEEQAAKAAAKKDDGEADPAADKTPKHPKKSAEQRIADITKARRTAERDLSTERSERATERASWERRLAALERGDLTVAPGATKTPSSDVDPKAEDYEFGENDPKFIRAVAKFEARQEMKADQAARELTLQTQQNAREAQERNEKKEVLYDAGRAKYEDFESVVIDGIENREFPLSPTLGKLCLNSDVGIDVVYYLASNPKLAAKIDGKTPVEQAAYFGRLEAQFSTEEVAPAKTPKVVTAKTTQAPAPIRGARGAGGNQQPVTADTNDFAAFEASVRAAAQK